MHTCRPKAKEIYCKIYDCADAVLQVLSCDWIFFQFCELKGYYFDSVLNIMKVFVLQLTHT